jgi:hypothetical protein
MTFLAGMVLRDGSRQVTMYDATPTVKNTRILYHGDVGGCDWGEGATNSSSAALARLILGQVEGQSWVPVDAFVSEFVRRRMTTGKMWILSLVTVREWLVSKQLLQ